MNIIGPVGRPMFPKRRLGGLSTKERRELRRVKRAQKDTLEKYRKLNGLGASNYSVFVPKSENIYKEELNRSILVNLIADINSETYRFFEELQGSYSMTPMIVDFYSALGGGRGAIDQSWAYSAMTESDFDDDMGDGMNAPYSPPAQENKRFTFGYWVGYYSVALCQLRDSQTDGFKLLDLLEIIAGRKTVDANDARQRAARFAAWLIIKLPEIYPVGVFGYTRDRNAEVKRRMYGGMVAEWMDDSERFVGKHLYSYPALYGFSAINQLAAEGKPVNAFSYLGDRQRVVDSTATTASTLNRILGQLVSTNAGMRFFQQTANVSRGEMFNSLVGTAAKVATAAANGANKLQQTAYLEGKLTEAEAKKGSKLTDAEKKIALDTASAEWKIQGNNQSDLGPATKYAENTAKLAVKQATDNELNAQFGPKIDKWVQDTIAKDPDFYKQNPGEAEKLRIYAQEYFYADMKFFALPEDKQRQIYSSAYDQALSSWGNAQQVEQDKKRQETFNNTKEYIEKTAAVTGLASGFINREISARAEQNQESPQPSPDDEFGRKSSMTSQEVVSAINSIVQGAATIGSSTATIASTVPPPAGPIAAGIYAGVCIGGWLGYSALRTIAEEVKNDPEYIPGSTVSYNEVIDDIVFYKALTTGAIATATGGVTVGQLAASIDYAYISAFGKNEYLSKREWDQAYMTALYCWTVLKWTAGDKGDDRFQSEMIESIQSEYAGLKSNGNENTSWMYTANFDVLEQNGYLPQILDTSIVIVNRNYGYYDARYQSFIGSMGSFVRDTDGELCARSSDCPEGKICVGTTCKVDPNAVVTVDTPVDNTLRNIALALGGISLLLIIGSAAFGKQKGGP